MRLVRLSVLVSVLILACAASALALRINGTNGPDTLRGTAKSDHVVGGAGNDKLYGLGGNDILAGGRGRDLLVGGPGNDRLYTRDGERDTISCGPGRDRVIGDQFDKTPKDCEVVLRKKVAGHQSVPVSEPPVDDEPPDVPTPPEPAEPPVVEATPGAYKGATSVGNYVFFDVTSDRRVVGFRVNDFRRTCDGPLTIYGGFDNGPNYAVPIRDDGSFAIQYHWDQGWAVDASHPATGDVNIVGYVQGSTASGTAQVSIEFDYQGRHWRCSTEQQTWTAARLP